MYLGTITKDKMTQICKEFLKTLYSTVAHAIHVKTARQN
jgi:hypothetical protein